MITSGHEWQGWRSLEATLEATYHTQIPLDPWDTKKWSISHVKVCCSPTPLPEGEAEASALKDSKCPAQALSPSSLPST